MEIPVNGLNVIASRHQFHPPKRLAVVQLNTAQYSTLGQSSWYSIAFIYTTTVVGTTYIY